MKIVAILIFIISFIFVHILKKKNIITSKIAFFMFSILIALTLEFSIFNIKSYRMMFSKENPITYYAEDLENESLKTISIENINEEVKTVYLKLSYAKNNESIKYLISYSDETTENRYLPQKEYVEDIEQTKYTAVYLSGKVNKISISIYTDEDIGIESVTLNNKIPFEFNIVRVGIVFLILFLGYSLKNDAFWNEKCKEGNLKQEIVYMLILIISILIIYAFNVCNSESDLDLYNYNLVNALEAGQFNLLEEPSEELLSLNNSYDAIERSAIERGKDYIWDAALYNNKYYVYFGILPALILFVPFHLITGTYFQTFIATMIFSILAMIIMSMIINFIFKKWFKNVPFKFMAFSEAIILISTFLIWINIAPRFYEMATVAGLYFVLQGLYLVLTAVYGNDKKQKNTKSENNDINVVESKINEESQINKLNKISYKRLTLGCLCMALAVACRPTELIISIVILPILIKLFVSNLKNINIKENTKLIFSVAIPYATVGILLMIYNYVRFGNILDFGAKYQLTMNDMMDLKNRLITVPAGFLCSLFNLPIFKSTFPFIQSNSNVLEMFAYYYIEDIPAGVFILSPIAFFSIGIFKFLKTNKNKELKDLTVSLLITAIILVIIVTMQAGSTGRYFLDFSWLFVLSGIIIFMNFYENYKTIEAKKILEKIFKIIVCYTLIINILTGFMDVSTISMESNNPKAFYKSEYTVCFWK